MIRPLMLRPPRLDGGDPLVALASRAWLGGLATGRGRIFPSGAKKPDGILTNMPTWVETQWGPGVQTDDNKYVDLTLGPRLVAPLSILLAYTYRFDASTNGSSTETGILYSQGQNGISIRHGATAVEYLKSRIVSINSFTPSPAAKRGEIHTVGLTIGTPVLSTASHKLYYDGQLVSTASSSNTPASTTTNIALGTDFGTTTREYGRHTILACFIYESFGNLVLDQNKIKDWHDAVRMGFRPLYIQPITLGDGLTHTPDAIATATQGLGFGATFFDPDAFDRTSQGIGLGATNTGLAELPGTTSQGVGLGATAGNVEAIDGTTQGFGLGATDSALADDLASTIQGIGLGAGAGNPDSFDNTTQGVGLGSTPTDVIEGVGFTTQGVGLGSTGSLGFLSDSTTQGLSFDVMVSDVIQNEAGASQGFALGSDPFLPDNFIRASFGMMFGSVPDEDITLSVGFGLGANFANPDSFASITAGLALSSRPTSDSGDLANGRYRR